jgi:hypothetical protein
LILRGWVSERAFYIVPISQQPRKIQDTIPSLGDAAKGFLMEITMVIAVISWDRTPISDFGIYIYTPENPPIPTD